MLACGPRHTSMPRCSAPPCPPTSPPSAPQWVSLARMLDAHRDEYDAFVVVHGTDTMAYTASALSLMLAGFRRARACRGGAWVAARSVRGVALASLAQASCALYPAWRDRCCRRWRAVADEQRCSALDIAAAAGSRSS